MTKTEIVAVVEMLDRGMVGVPTPEQVETHLSRVWRNLGGDIYAVSHVEIATCLKRQGDERYSWHRMPMPSQLKAHLRTIREWREAGANI